MKPLNDNALKPPSAVLAPSRKLRLLWGPLALLSMGTIWVLGFALAKLAGEHGAHPIGLVLWETIGSGVLLLTVCMALGRYPRLPLRQIDPDSPRGNWIASFGVLRLVALPLAALRLTTSRVFA